ncbi:MAG: hypothetical protein D8H99_08710, partial [Streptococcus sp.]
NNFYQRSGFWGGLVAQRWARALQTALSAQNRWGSLSLKKAVHRAWDFLPLADLGIATPFFIF